MLGERGGQQTESHRDARHAGAARDGRATASTSDPARRALPAIASLTSISSWPSANVGERRSAARRPGEDVRVDRPEERPEGVTETLDVAARQRGGRLAGRAHQRRVPEQDLVRPVAVAEPQVVRRLRVPRRRRSRTVDLPLQGVLPARR